MVTVVRSIDPLPTLSKALEAIDELRADMVSGKAVAFVACTVENDDQCALWCGASKPVSRLRLIGAWCHSLFMFQHGDVMPVKPEPIKR